MCPIALRSASSRPAGLRGRGRLLCSSFRRLSWIAVIGLVMLLGLLCQRVAPGCTLVRRLLSVHPAVRAVGQRHGDAGLDRHRRAAWRCTAWSAARPCRFSLAPCSKKFLTPVLDLMQTVPVFAYLVPILFLFGFGPTAAVVATIVYALPPMTRVAIVALKGCIRRDPRSRAHGRLL